jgi:hypothetical protein
MSVNASNPQPAYDRTAPRGTQFTPVFTVVQEFLDSTRKSVSLPVTFDHFGIVDFTSNPAKGEDTQAWTATKFITYTRAQLTKHFSDMVLTCMEHCSATFSKHIPNRSAYTAKDIAAILTHSYTVTKGDNKDAVRNHMAHFQAAARNTIKRNTATNNLSEAVENGDAWMAEGVVDKKGNPVPWLTEAKAKKAHARKAHTDSGKSGDWYEPKTRKTAYLDAAVVCSYMQEMAVTMDTLRTMNHVRVRQLARKAGAPDSVTTGAGAKARSIEWFSVDVARIALANRQ